MTHGVGVSKMKGVPVNYRVIITQKERELFICYLYLKK